MTGPMVLTQREWQWWFGVSGAEADRLVSVQQALAAAGIDCCPETVLGMSRAVLVDGTAPQRLRRLADLWEAQPAPVVDAGQGWPIVGELPSLSPHRRSDSSPDGTDGRPHLCRMHLRPRRAYE